MSGQTIVVRDETPDDVDMIDAIHERAFGGRAEADLVRSLRRGGHGQISLVSTVEAAVVGHVLFAGLKVVRHHGNFDGLALAPLAVDPAFQRRGIGSALVRAGLERATAMGERIVFVLGDPAYYGRFGFTADAAKGFECVYACEAFQALVLDGNGPVLLTGKVVYPPPFAELGGDGHG